MYIKMYFYLLQLPSTLIMTHLTFELVTHQVDLQLLLLLQDLITLDRTQLFMMMIRAKVCLLCLSQLGEVCVTTQMAI